MDDFISRNVDLFVIGILVGCIRKSIVLLFEWSVYGIEDLVCERLSWFVVKV